MFNKIRKLTLLNKNISIILIVLLVISFVTTIHVIPIVKADDTNLAPIFQNGTSASDCSWGDYDGTNVYYGTHTNPQICFRDDAVTHSSHSSIRLEAPNAYNLYREVNFNYIAVSPGDVVRFGVWIKTAAGTGDAGIIGFDVYGDVSRILEVHSCTPQADIWNIVDGVPTQGGTNLYVSYGSDWTWLQFEVTIPSTTYTYSDYGTPISPQQISGIIPWMGGVWNGRASYPNIWFADAELYVNPTSEISTILGDSTIEANTEVNDNGYLNVIKSQAPSSGNISSIQLYTANSSGSPYVKGVIYADNSGSPGSLISSGNSIAVTNSSFNWVTLTGLNATVSTGTYYWLGFFCGDGAGDQVSIKQSSSGTVYAWNTNPAT